MTNSNLNFKSNIYPVNGFIRSDPIFLSHVMDGERLKSLGKSSRTYDSTISEFQRKVIAESAICTYANGDPCWGLIYQEGQPTWQCKCVNSKCRLISRCNPYLTEEDEIAFSPTDNKCIDYEYTFEYIYNINPPSIIKEEYLYDSNEIIDNENNFEDLPPSEFNFINLPQENLQPSLIEDDELEDELPDYDEVTYSTLALNMYETFIETDQMSIIKASLKSQIFVDAGPGTGKTHTLLQRINYLISECDAIPDDIVVLSFTNAAVNEVYNRLSEFVSSGGDRGLRNVFIRTFHSLAWWLLGQANENIDLQSNGWRKVSMDLDSDYDKCLIDATRLLKNYPDFISRWTLIVDEVQDLTNERAEFVQALINAVIINKDGFVIFGDSCQAIYDYPVDGVALRISSKQFYENIYNLMRQNASSKYFRLTKNHRMNDEMVNLTYPYREAILKTDKDQLNREIHRIALNIKKTDDDISLEYTSLIKLVPEEEKRVCLLCRNNGQVLNLSTLFHKKGISHRVNTNENIENFSKWISIIFFDYEPENISKDTFVELYDTRNNDIEMSGITVWNHIKRLLRTENNQIKVDELLEAIRTCKIDDPIFRNQPNQKIIISNIHKAKGREYEQVIIDAKYINEFKRNNTLCEYKTVYVALTRPKTAAHSLLFPDSEGIWKKDFKQWNTTKRWRKRGIRKKLTHVEFDNTDIDRLSFIHDSEVPQGFIADIRDGDEIMLKRVVCREGNVKYKVIMTKDDDENCLGFTKEDFIDDIWNMLGKPVNAYEYPVTINDLYVSGVHSYINKEYDRPMDKARQQKKQVWLWLDFKGFAHLNYDVY